MRGLSTTALLLAAVLEGRSFALDETEIILSSAPAETKHGLEAGNLFIEGPDSTTELIQDTIVDEITEDELPVDEYPEVDLDNEQAYLEYLEFMIYEFQTEINAREDRLRYMPSESSDQNSDDIIGSCDGSPLCIVKSAFRKSIQFITSLGSDIADEDDFFDGPKKPPGKGHWHWPKFPFPHHGNHTHHGHGNHTHGNHTFPPHFPHHGNHTHGNHTFPPHFPHHGNHTHGNHTHGNHTHPPHGPPFRLPPHFCRPPHHKPPHKRPHHPSHPPPGNGEPPSRPEPPRTTTLSTQIDPIHYPLVQITITPAKLLISALLFIIVTRIFHRIRRTRMSRRLNPSLCPYTPHQAERKTRFRNFINKLRFFSKRREQNPAPPLTLYHEYGDEKVFSSSIQSIQDSDICAMDGDEYCDLDGVTEKEIFLNCGGLDEKRGSENNYDYCDGYGAFHGNICGDDGYGRDEKMGHEEDTSSVEEELASFRSAADLVCDMVVAAEEGRAGRVK